MKNLKITVKTTDDETHIIQIQTPQTIETYIEHAFQILATKTHFIIKNDHELTIFGKDELRHISIAEVA